MWAALKAALAAAMVTAAICAVAVASKAGEPAFTPQQVTWFCRTAERVEVLMGSPGRTFIHGFMLSVAKGDCGIGLHGATFLFMPEVVAAKGTSSEDESYVVLKGRLFIRIVEGGIEAYAPFDAATFDEKLKPEKTKGQAI